MIFSPGGSCLDSSVTLIEILFLPRHPKRFWRKLSAFVCLIFLAGTYSPLFSAEHDLYQRFDFRLKWQAAEKWYLKNSYQVRFRDMIRQYHYFKMELGAGLKVSERLDLSWALRFEDRHSTTEGHFKKSLLIDPTFLIEKNSSRLAAGLNWVYDRSYTQKT